MDSCDTKEGRIVGLIDSIIFIAKTLSEKDLQAIEVQEALKDLKACKELKSLLK